MVNGLIAAKAHVRNQIAINKVNKAMTALEKAIKEQEETQAHLNKIISFTQYKAA